MIFLIEYDRPSGKLVTFQEFDDSERKSAEKHRLEIELALHREDLDHEVVVLEAVTKEALERTHRRYFETARQIVESTGKELK